MKYFILLFSLAVTARAGYFSVPVLGLSFVRGFYLSQEENPILYIDVRILKIYF